MAEFGGMVAARLSISLNVRSVNHEIVTPPASGSISRRSSSAQYRSTGELPATTATDVVSGRSRKMFLRSAARSRCVDTAVSLLVKLVGGIRRTSAPIINIGVAGYNDARWRCTKNAAG